MVNESTKIPFGDRHKNTRIKDCGVDYLQWMVKHLIDTDLHEYAIVARRVLSTRRGETKYDDLERAADEFLREHGVDPKQFSDNRKRR